MRKYSKYKDGVEWMGPIPEGWVVIPLKHFCDVRDGTHDTPKYVTPDINSLPLVTSKDLFNGILSLEYTNHISSNDYNEIIKRSEVSYGDILMPMIGTVGGAVVVNTKASFAIKNIALFKYSSKYNNKWLFYLLNSEIVSIQFDLNKTGGVQNFVSLGSLRNLIIFYPPLPEQHAIVQFLDHKTNQIDRFIANRQKQIELLKEQKAGIINKAVTKGIGLLSVSTERSRSGVETPNTKMKDSGIEWIGEVPEHWRKLRLKNIAKRITNGFVGSTSNILQENGVRYIQALHVKQNKIIFNQPYYVSEKWSNEHPRSILKEGDIVITQTGAMTGDVGLVASEFEGSNCHALIIVKPEKRKIIPEYLLSLLTSNFGKSLLFSIRTGSMHPHLNSTIVCDIYLPIPEVLSEQQSIIDFINIETSTIDTLISKYQKQIDLMQEYRTALISQAVTGKINCLNQDLQD